MSVIITQNQEIIQALCKGAVSEAGLLSYLQATYPDSQWTESLLSTRLAQGVKEGRFKKIGSNPAGPVEGYAINPYMVVQNSGINAQYAGYCNSIKPVSCATPCCGGTKNAI